MKQSNVQTDVYNFEIDKRLYLEDKNLIKRLFIRLKQSVKSSLQHDRDSTSIINARKCCREANKLLKKYKTLDTVDAAYGLLLTAESYFYFCERQDLAEICKQQKEQLDKYSTQLVEDKINVLLDLVKKDLIDENYHQAILTYDDLCICYDRVGKEDLAKEMKKNAELCRRKLNYVSAEKGFQKAEKLREEGNFDAAIDAAYDARTEYAYAAFNEQDEQKCDDFINLCMKERAEMKTKCEHEGERLFELARSKYFKQEFAEAKKLFDEAKSLFEKAMCYTNFDTINQLSERCEKFMQAENQFDTASTYYSKGNYYEAYTNFTIAKRMFEELYYERFPSFCLSSIKAKRMIEELFHERKDCENLVKDCDKLLRQSKKDYANMMFSNGSYNFNAQNYYAAITCFEKAMNFGYDRLTCEIEINKALLMLSLLKNEKREPYYDDNDEESNENYYDDDDSGYSDDDTEDDARQKQQEIEDNVAEVKSCIEKGYFDDARKAIKAAEEAGLSVYEASTLTSEVDIAEREAEQADDEDEYGDD